MDGSDAIEWNRQALKRIVATLVDMAGLAEPAPQPDRRAKGTPRATIPRLLWRAIVRLLRPAESAARRLIIAASRGIVVPAPRLREPEAEPPTIDPMLRKLGIAVMIPSPGPARSDFLARLRKARRTSADGGEPRIPTFPLFDPPRRLHLFGQRRRTVPPHLAPRISVPGFTEPVCLPPPPSDDDLVSVGSLTRRLAALSAALDDLPGQAKRFARWKASRKAAELAAKSTKDENRAPWRPRRFSPLRLGRPPGGRLFRYDPNVAHPPNIREVDKILAHAHSMALYALECPDTS